MLLKEKRFWKRFAVETFLVLLGIALLTLAIFLLPFSPRTSDGLLLYLLAILIFASLLGLYAALLASFVSFFTFDYFFVPPIYGFRATTFEDLLSLSVFLIVAIIAGRLASSLRVYALQARQRAYETQILYEFVRATNRESDVEQQLKIFVRSVVDVFSSEGIHDCMLLLPDLSGILRPLKSAYQLLDKLPLLPDEEEAASWIVLSAHAIDVYDPLFSAVVLDSYAPAREKWWQVGRGQRRFLVRLIPLKIEAKVFGVLRLLLEDKAEQVGGRNMLGIEQPSPSAQDLFFSTFLEQAVTVIEQRHLREASVHLEVLQKTEMLRSALLSSVSHDLRTPLATIKAAVTSFLQEETLAEHESWRTVASAVEREVDRLDDLVENILDMSRIEAGSLHLEKVWYPLDELVRETLHALRLSLRGRAVHVSCSEALPPVEIDAVQVRQVLHNLLENVVRYTPAGSPVDISIQIQDNDFLVIVEDRGPGIPLSEREHIFDKFYRVGESSGALAHPGGLGLGLAICQGIISAHNGQIWVEQRNGGGARFCFTLPFHEIGVNDLDE